MNTEKIMEDIQSVQDNIREIKSTWGNTIMTLDNIKSGLKADVQKKVDEAYKRGYNDAKQNAGEEYQRGYCEGYKKCLSENDFDQPCVSCGDYQSGLDDAMSAFKKLYSCGWERDWKAMGFEFDEGEWSTSFEFIIDHYTAAEIVKKVKAYEEKELHVGDEVIAPCGKAIVTTFKNDLVFYLYSVGDYGCTEPENLTKTGRHFDIQSILGAMKS